MEEKYYLVTIEETLSRTVKVKANSIEEAERKVEDAYNPPRCEIILDADDFCEKEITAREVANEDLDLYEEIEEDEDKDEYCPSSTNRDYSPSNPWDAPGMSIKDFI